MRLFEVTMNAINLGLWLSPDGDYIKVDSNHVADIISNPSKFGVTSEFIQQLYAKHNERMGVEGNAREELIKLVLQRGWVRIRNYRNYWSVTVDRLNPKVVNNIRNWVDSFIQRDIMGKYADIKVYEAARDKMRTLDAIKIVTHHALEESATIGVLLKMIKETHFSELPDLELLTEVKLSRVYHYFTGDIPVGIITAFRGEETEETNVRNNRQLASTLRSAGFGYTWVDGAWVENEGTPQETHVSEVSILVAGEQGSDDKLFSTLQQGAQRYNQDAFVFKPSGSDAKIGIYDKSGNLEMSFDSARLDQIGTIYTKLRSGGHEGRSFVFEGERLPVGYAGRLAGQSD